MTTKKLIVLFIACGVAYVLAEVYLPDGQLKVLINICLFIAICMFSILAGRHEFLTRKKRDAENVKVEVVEGIRHEPLTKAEVNFLKRKMNRKMAGISIGILLWFIIYVLATNFFLPAFFGKLGEYLFWILAVLIFSTAVYFINRHIQKLRNDIREGQKLVVTGNITRWESHSASEDDYMFFINEIGFRVTPAVFKKYLKGDAIEVHLFEPWKNMLMFERKLMNN